MAEARCAIVLLGPPGSGKTTLARLLALRGRVPVLELGNLLESEVRRDTPLGRHIKPHKVAGKLVPSELVRQILSSELKRVDGKLVLFDGFPRSLEQIELFFDLLKEHQLDPCGVIFLNLDSQTAVNRISGRRFCVDCGALYNIYTQPPKIAGICDRCGGRLIQRADDRVEVVRDRFKSYERVTLPVVEYFRKEFGNLLWEESATASPDQLVDRLWPRLEGALPALARRDIERS